MRKEVLTDAELLHEKERLIRELKKHVKHVMEESVAKKCVHEESSNVSAVCSIVDTCLALGLRRRALGLFRTSSSVALLQKISKENEDAGAVLKRIEELEKVGSEARRKSSSSSDSIISFSTKSQSKVDSSSNLVSSTSNRFFWIRIALFEKRLHRIISFLCKHADRFFESKRSLLGDPDYGPLLASLLVGPCALDYSRGVAIDQYWYDPPADELVQRHRISSFTCKGSQPSTPNRGFKRRISNQYDADERRSSIPYQAREYVESLHQNKKSALIYGKNNVNVVQRNSSALPGYLSLHQDSETGLTLKWTPNSLMDKRSPLSACSSPHSPVPGPPTATWQQAIQINMSSILYIHSHQDKDTDGTLVLVGQDGVQYPPINFPTGVSMLSFLGCLESALLPLGVLNPPLSTQQETAEPRTDEGGVQGRDCVYKIDFTSSNSVKDGFKEYESIHKTRSLDWLTNIFNKSKKNESVTADVPQQAEAEDQEDIEDPQISQKTTPDYNRYLSESSKSTFTAPSPSTPLKGLCRTMRGQLISRAFYGWLAHCRHMKTIRTHLSGLVLAGFDAEVEDVSGLTSEAWSHCKSEGLQNSHIQDTVYRLVYCGGIQHTLRREVWQYMLGHLEWGYTSQEIHCKDGMVQSEYESKISEWGALEAIVLQQDREMNAANIARMSLCNSAPDPSLTSETGIPNDVFESMDSMTGYRDCATPERPSTITEVTEQSSADQSRSKFTSSSSSSSFTGAAVQNSLDKRREDMRFPGAVSASDEGIEDINEDEEFSEDVRVQALPREALLSSTQFRRNIGGESEQSEFGYKITTPSIDSGNPDSSPPDGKLLEDKLISRGESDDRQRQGSCPTLNTAVSKLASLAKDFRDDLLVPASSSDLLVPTTSSVCPSPASSEGGTYSLDILESFGLNLHRIDKDVARCDRNLEYFSKTSNLEKLRNVITTYVWENLEEGYMQGMCDLVAPLLVVIDDEAIVYSCFKTLMKRMILNFPIGDQMDTNFANMRALMQVLDQSLYDAIQQNGDFSHFYFSYRWFLLDFKREFSYSSVYLVWETIWAAARVSSDHFYLFIALGLVETYRDIILDRNMDFTDIIKFFNEMSERHDTKTVLDEAKFLINSLHTLVKEAE